MIKKLFLIFILIQSVALSEWNIIKIPLNKEETLFKKELMLELGSGDNISLFMNVGNENISFTIFKKDGENPFKKDDTIFRFKVDNKLIETKPTSGSTFRDNVTFSLSTLLISGEKYKEIVEAFKDSSELKILIMNSSGVKMLFDISLDNFNRQIHELNF